MHATVKYIGLCAALAFAGIASAHGDEMAMDMGNSMDMSHDAMSAPVVSNENMPDTFFRHGEHGFLLYSHIALMTVSWVFVLPVAVMLSIARSRHQLTVETVFQIINTVGMFVGSIYRARTPDLYPNNVHNKFGWFMAGVFVTIHAIFMVVRRFALEPPQRSEPNFHERMGFMPLSTNEEGFVLPKPDIESARLSGESGQSSERTMSPTGEMRPSVEHHMEHHHHERQMSGVTLEDTPDYMEEVEKPRLRFGPALIEEFIASKVPKIRSQRVAAAIETVYFVLDRIRIPLGFVAYLTGIVTMAGIFMGNDVFNGLAHFIKGGIFFGYGILTLGRWLGCFGEFGWAWNVNPMISAKVPSAEFVESAVIFTYGCTNVFLEHLAAWGQAWHAEDLEHVSISIMFFGGGLLGMFVESKRIRRWLNTHLLFNTANKHFRSAEAVQEPKTYNFSMNPVPALIILLLGTMMGSHHQASMVSTMVHGQWGTLLSGFSLARGVTYLLFFLSPPKSILPSRPPTELVSAFCLMAGGIIFMASNRDTVEAMERWNLDAMFVFTVTMGFVAFLMAWITTVVAIKGVALRKEQPNARWAQD